MMFTERIILKVLFLPLIWISSCKEDPAKDPYSDWQQITVLASAYNSVGGQGSGDPKITAWGDTLKPGVRSIAVSRDLIEKGLDYRTPVIIEGFEGTFLVMDKMHPRWRNKIDIYMGEDRDKALKWGRRKVEICFPPPEKRN